MAQVDCQHRLGYLHDSPIPFAFMAYIGLTIEEEMEIFRVINGKAKGLSGSLLDFTEARLVEDDLKAAKPELFLALVLHEEQRSPWYQRLDLGGNRTTGPMRVASLTNDAEGRTSFLAGSGLPNKDVDETSRVNGDRLLEGSHFGSCRAMEASATAYVSQGYWRVLLDEPCRRTISGSNQLRASLRYRLFHLGTCPTSSTPLTGPIKDR